MTTEESQDQSEFFRGTAAVGLKDERSTDRIDPRSIPAFVAGEELADLADTDNRIVVLTADLKSANRTSDFEERHPDHFFDFGIAEKNMITAAAGMAACGYIPYLATFASFAALLGCEQIRTDCAYPQLPVRILAHHSGITMGFYGTSHHSTEDLGIMRTMADLTVVCATDANHLRAILRASVNHPGAMYIRLGRGRDPEVYADVPQDFQFGRAITLRQGEDVTLVATGSEVRAAIDAATVLEADGISARVLDMHTIKPLDAEALIGAARSTGNIVVVEEHNVVGGLGSAAAEVLLESGVPVRFKRHGIYDEYALIGPPKALYAHYQLDSSGIAEVVRHFISH